MHFGGMGFGGSYVGGGRSGRSFRKENNVDTTKFYTLLGVTKSSTEEELRKSYRKLALKHHPDKGGDPAKFKELGRAYEVLSDPEKRQMYDNYGEDGLEGTGPAADATDIFDIFFGGGVTKKQQQRKRQGENIVTKIKVTLEQIYTGCTRKMAVNRHIICKSCDGHGGPADAYEECMACNGTGIRMITRQMGIVIQKSQSPCQKCGAQGRTMPPEKRCNDCQATGTVRERKVLEVFIEKGVVDGHKVVFGGEADHKPNEVPGDVIFVVQTADHQRFTRRGSNLYCQHQITLFEALSEFNMIIKHLDERIILVTNKPKDIIMPNAVRVIPDEGMPYKGRPFTKGLLIISFDVVFPSQAQLPKNYVSLLKAVLPQPTPIDPAQLKSAHETVECTTTNEHIISEHEQQQVSDDEMEHEQGDKKIQCQQQ